MRTDRSIILAMIIVAIIHRIPLEVMRLSAGIRLPGAEKPAFRNALQFKSICV